MTLNELIKKSKQISWMLTSGDIPLTMNGQPIETYDITLEGENGNYHADIKILAHNESGFEIIDWPDIQYYMELEGFEENATLIEPHGALGIDSSTYLVSKEWLESLNDEDNEEQ